jgi:hypothetical protein
MAWVWALRYAARRSKRMAGGCGRQTMTLLVHLFTLRYLYVGTKLSPDPVSNSVFI